MQAVNLNLGILYLNFYELRFCYYYLPDFRNVLYWSPNVNVNDKGEGKLSFYTSDVAGTYIGTVNGVSKNGTFGNATFTFKVNEKSN